MNRYPTFIDPTCSRYGEFEVIDTPDWFVVIGTAVVVIGLAWCVWKVIA